MNRQKKKISFLKIIQIFSKSNDLNEKVAAMKNIRGYSFVCVITCMRILPNLFFSD